MQTNYECIPCFIHQALKASRFAGSDDKAVEAVLREVLKAVSMMDLKKSPPVMGQYIHRIIRKFSGNDDPYQDIKAKCNQDALKLLPSREKIVAEAPNRFETAVRLVIAGNIIDFGVNTDIDYALIKQNIALSLSEQLFGHWEELYQEISTAQNILYLGDNTGEIVFDRLLLQQLPADRVIFAVRGSPVINDATMSDAVATGITQMVSVIDNGSDAPGTVLEECSDIFREAFQNADLVISKGQGNYETLSDFKHKKIFFLLKAKCSVIAQHIGCDVGDFVIDCIS